MRGHLTKITALSAALAIGAIGTASVVAAGGGAERPASVPPAGEPFGPACADLPSDGDGSPTAMAGLPAGDATASNLELTTLTSAVEIAGLLETLNGDGPFTILAPNDDAFDKIPTAVLDAILADPTQLTDLLGFHIIEGEALTAAQLAQAGSATALDGSELTFTEAAGTLTVNGTTSVVCADLTVANGVVHIIDSVLQPPSSDLGIVGSSSSVPISAPNVTAVATPAAGPQGPACADLPAEGEGSIVEAATLPLLDALAANPDLTSLVEYIDAAGLSEQLEGEGPFTVLAPTNEAFEALPPEDLDALAADPARLAAVLGFHVIEGQSLDAAALATAAAETSVQGGELSFASQADGSLSINNGAATVVCSNIVVANGMVHMINSVLVPTE